MEKQITFNIKKYQVKIIDMIDYEELEQLDYDCGCEGFLNQCTCFDFENIYDEIVYNDYNLIDYCDGDFKYIINLATDKRSWVQRLIKFLPEDVIKRNKFAIRYSQ